MTGVMHVITGLGTGGAETMLVQLAVALQARGQSQHVVSLTAHDALAADLRAGGVEFTMLNARSLASLAGAIAGLARAVNRMQPAILQGWMYHGNIAATLSHYACAGRIDRKLFWNLRASNMDEKRYGRILWLSKMLSRAPQLVIANSEAGVAFHRERGFNPKQFEVLDNGVDTIKFKPDAAMRKKFRGAFGIADGAVVVIHIARVDPMKDHENFLAAMSRLPQVQAILVGSGTQTLALPNNVRALGPRDDIAQLLTAADIIASTSAFGEGFSNAIAEGMCAGLVPVATDVGDAHRIVGDTGAVVPPASPDAFAQALAEMASLSPRQRAQKGAAARERIISHFNLGAAIDRYFQLYAGASRDLGI
jgi:glycosyltransferase involved in cell wall biosynthesis